MDNRRDEPNLKLINMEQVEVEKIDWLLYPFIPFGKVTIVQGDPGEGKTTMVLQIIAKLTKGEAVLPSGSDEPALAQCWAYAAVSSCFPRVLTLFPMWQRLF